jgi:hypothetical protein
MRTIVFMLGRVVDIKNTINDSTGFSVKISLPSSGQRLNFAADSRKVYSVITDPHW